MAVSSSHSIVAQAVQVQVDTGVYVNRQGRTPSVVNERQSTRSLIPHPATVPLHPGVSGHLDLHLFLLLLSVGLRHIEGETRRLFYAIKT